MQLQTGQVLELRDAQQRLLGRVTLKNREDDLLSGHFVPGPAFSSVERLFRDFEEAVNAQALGALDKLDAAIAALGLRLAVAGNGDEVGVEDVQIWSDGGVTCRLSSRVPAGVNGGPESTATVKPEASA